MTKDELIASAKKGDKLFVVLKRIVFTTKSTIGELWANGVFLCHMLEDFDRGLHQWMEEDEIKSIKIFGKTAIPRGMYKVKMTYSPKYDRMMPQILDVKCYSGVRMHSGNDADDTEGCPLFGDYNPKQKDGVANSRKCAEEFYTLVDSVGVEFDLIIC